MKNFLAIYLGSADPNAKLEITDAQKRAGMDKWMKWTTDNASAIVDLGSPLGKTKKINADGVSDTRNRMTAYTIVQADSHDAAAQLFITTHTSRCFPATRWRSWNAFRYPLCNRGTWDVSRELQPQRSLREQVTDPTSASCRT